ncbi:MAG: hypothetical protein HOH76_04440 [Hellea sp.]|nr:hypothetical protein [Hellea sp.]
MKKILLLVFLIPNLVTTEEKFIPVIEYTANNPNWQSNIYEILYVAYRCGFAYSSAHHELVEHIGDDGVKVDLYIKGLRIAMTAVEHVENTYGDISLYDFNSITFTVRAIDEFYYEQAKMNYKGNSQFGGTIGNDLKSCEGYDTFFESIVIKDV